MGGWSRRYHWGGCQFLKPADGLFERVVQNPAGRCAFPHRSRRPVDSGRRPARALGGRRLHARQAGVDALDGRISPFRVDFDDKFKLVVGH